MTQMASAGWLGQAYAMCVDFEYSVADGQHGNGKDDSDSVILLCSSILSPVF